MGDACAFQPQPGLLDAALDEQIPQDVSLFFFGVVGQVLQEAVVRIHHAAGLIVQPRQLIVPYDQSPHSPLGSHQLSTHLRHVLPILHRLTLAHECDQLEGCSSQVGLF